VPFFARALHLWIWQELVGLYLSVDLSTDGIALPPLKWGGPTSYAPWHK